ncbi:DUF84 family protein [Alkalihalophilus pseudofirmus]|uniref:DUF84 family protein n=1 Tax=Alkalihalophilus pseudofirmus TaxID=79885 RepID=UPI00259B2D03|nr:DUF84 family protein [Alkalihalophilus pseudofirmus]WEG16275.1 DUF84 family protein [Alkalihalophilus pseudofirmus]
MKLAIGTKNPAKVHAVMDTLIREPLEFISIDAPSGVSAQPFSEEETLEGAINRAKFALSEAGSKIAVGLEGGVCETPNGIMLCNWGALTDHLGGVWIASGAKIPLPSNVERKLKEGYELGVIMSELMQDPHIRHKEGAVGVFTSGMLTRKEMFSHIVRLLYGQYQFDRPSYSH